MPVLRDYFFFFGRAVSPISAFGRRRHARCKQMQRLSTRNRPHTYRPTSRIDLPAKASTASKASTFSSRLARPLFLSRETASFFRLVNALIANGRHGESARPAPPSIAQARSVGQPPTSPASLKQVRPDIHFRLHPPSSFRRCSRTLIPPEEFKRIASSLHFLHHSLQSESYGRDTTLKMATTQDGQQISPTTNLSKFHQCRKFLVESGC